MEKVNRKESNKGIRSFKEHLSNPFVRQETTPVMDINFITSLSRRSINIIKYLVQKNAYTDEKFIFDLKEFNEMMNYAQSSSPTFKSFAELCEKGILARTNIPYVFWVNKNMLETGLVDSMSVIPKRVK